MSCGLTEEYEKLRMMMSGSESRSLAELILSDSCVVTRSWSWCVFLPRLVYVTPINGPDDDDDDGAEVADAVAVEAEAKAMMKKKKMMEETIDRDIFLD